MGLWDDFKEMAGDAGDWLLEKGQKVAIDYGGTAGAALAVGSQGVRNEVAAAVKETPEDTLGAFERGLSKSWETVEDAALNAYAQSETSAAVDAGLVKAEAVLEDAKKAAGEGLSRAGAVLEFLTRPWVLLGIGGVVVLAIAAPYVTPFLSTAANRR